MKRPYGKLAGDHGAGRRCFREAHFYAPCPEKPGEASRLATLERLADIEPESLNKRGAPLSFGAFRIDRSTSRFAYRSKSSTISVSVGPPGLTRLRDSRRAFPAFSVRGRRCPSPSHRTSALASRTWQALYIRHWGKWKYGLRNMMDATVTLSPDGELKSSVSPKLSHNQRSYTLDTPRPGL